jgi:hypothetical protein
MSIRISLPSFALCAFGALALTFGPALAQQSIAPGASDGAMAPKPAKPAKKVAAKGSQADDIPTIGAPAVKAKASKEEKPKSNRPFGELEGWSSASEAEKKKLAAPRDESSSGYKKPPIGFDSGGHMGMGIGF